MSPKKEELYRLIKESELIAEIGRIVSSTLNIEDVYERFAEKVREVIPFDRLAINTINKIDHTRIVSCVKGGRFAGDRVGDVQPFTGTGIVEKFLSTKSSLLIDSRNREEMMRAHPGMASMRSGAQSTMMLPLISKDELIGILAFHSVEIDAYSEYHLRLAERMASQIAGAVANAQLLLERKRVEEELRKSEAKYYDLYENAPDMYYTADLVTGAIKECNETLLRTTGYSREELIGRPIFELYEANSAEAARELFQRFPAAGVVSDVERRVKCKDGRIIDVSLNVSAIRDKDGNITSSRSSWRDITERKEQEEMIRSLAITDQLTGLYNRRGFTALAEQQLRIAERTGNGIALLFADVDDLKKINDRFGHKSGDGAIVETANVLKEVLRKMDIIARIGGDEFAVLAPEASLKYSETIKDRLQDQLGIHNSRAGRHYHLSLSIGIVYHAPPHIREVH